MMDLDMGGRLGSLKNLESILSLIVIPSSFPIIQTWLNLAISIRLSGWGSVTPLQKVRLCQSLSWQAILLCLVEMEAVMDMGFQQVLVWG